MREFPRDPECGRHVRPILIFDEHRPLSAPLDLHLPTCADISASNRFNAPPPLHNAVSRPSPHRAAPRARGSPFGCSNRNIPSNMALAARFQIRKNS
ncbi:MAG: hypothetical protein FWD68_18995 [Alphaproteobacteria bacterium]|nr:hypothetical protein [Alphaproteobacteria bacterium]